MLGLNCPQDPFLFRGKRGVPTINTLSLKLNPTQLDYILSDSMQGPNKQTKKNLQKFQRKMRQMSGLHRLYFGVGGLTCEIIFLAKKETKKLKFLGNCNLYVSRFPCLFRNYWHVHEILLGLEESVSSGVNICLKI